MPASPIYTQNVLIRVSIALFFLVLFFALFLNMTVQLRKAEESLQHTREDQDKQEGKMTLKEREELKNKTKPVIKYHQ